MLFQARQSKFVFPGPALVMGIVNVTPDSFSDGGKCLDVEAAVAHALKLAEQGAEILDIGGESTRPGATPVSETEELRRVIPVIERLSAEIHSPTDEVARRPVLISIDTMKPGVARAALQAGAAIVNDVAADREDDAMWKAAAAFNAGYICMHAKAKPVYDDVLCEVMDFFRDRLERLNAAGVSPDQVVFDVGIGFGKTLEQTLLLLARLREFKVLGRPLLLGVSRKSFIEKLTGAPVNQRLPASLACATLGIEAGAQIIRAHDVAETVQAVRMAEAIVGKT